MSFSRDKTLPDGDFRSNCASAFGLVVCGLGRRVCPADLSSAVLTVLAVLGGLLNSKAPGL